MVGFRNRKDAGQRLASELTEYKGQNIAVLAIPRGGVVLGYEVAKALQAPMDIIVPRKIGAPGNPELAIGAVAEDETTVLDPELIRMLGVSKEYIQREKIAEVAEIERRNKAYRRGIEPLDLLEKTVIIVDDGLATGATMRAAVASARKKGARKVIVAVPVAPPETVAKLAREVDRVVCPLAYEPFLAIGQFYDDFRQVEDDEVIRLIEEAQRWRL